MERDRDVEGLIRALQHEDWHVRGREVSALWWIGDERAVKPLIRVLKDKYLAARVDTKKALIRIGKSAVEPLINALKDEERVVRGNAAIALWRDRRQEGCKTINLSSYG